LLWGGLGANALTAVIAVHAIYSLVELIGFGFETPGRALVALIVDVAFFGVWAWAEPSVLAPLTCASALASATLLHDRLRAAVAIAVVLILSAILDSSALPAVTALAAFAAAAAFYKHYLEGRMSTTLRHNVVIRSQAQTAREAERQRIAADFHDGPLQNFVGFQLRLEIIRRQMERDVNVSAAGTLQEPGRGPASLCPQHEAAR
jgi:signal transduction histidine kinase